MVTTSTMHALPITTPSVVRKARTLLARKASKATTIVSPRSMPIGAAPVSNYNKPAAKRPGGAGPLRITLAKLGRMAAQTKIPHARATSVARFIVQRGTSGRGGGRRARSCCAGSIPQPRDSPSRPQRTAPGAHRAARAIRAHRRAKEDRSAGGLRQGRTSATSRLLPGGSPPGRASRPGKSSGGGRKARDAQPPRRPLPSAARHCASGRNRRPRSRDPGASPCPRAPGDIPVPPHRLSFYAPRAGRGPHDPRPHPRPPALPPVSAPCPRRRPRCPAPRGRTRSGPTVRRGSKGSDAPPLRTGAASSSPSRTRKAGRPVLLYGRRTGRAINGTGNSRARAQQHAQRSRRRGQNREARTSIGQASSRATPLALPRRLRPAPFARAPREAWRRPAGNCRRQIDGKHLARVHRRLLCGPPESAALPATPPLAAGRRRPEAFLRTGSSLSRQSNGHVVAQFDVARQRHSLASAQSLQHLILRGAGDADLDFALVEPRAQASISNHVDIAARSLDPHRAPGHHERVAAFPQVDPHVDIDIG